MKVFKEYARYYDLLYRDKDYEAEARYVDGLIRSRRHGAGSILDMGCGTGNHALCLARMDYDVVGVDLSEVAIGAARGKLNGPGQISEKVRFESGDIRTIRLGQTFDVVLSLFHVMSYQTSNEDLEAAFRTAAAHANPGGLFIFDCWYGPGVLTDRPIPRIKTVRDDGMAVTRFAEPRMLPNENVVQIDYCIWVRDRSGGILREFGESHRMRYLFQPEIHRLFSANGFEGIACEEWLTGVVPDLNTWNLCCIGTKRHDEPSQE